MYKTDFSPMIKLIANLRSGVRYRIGVRHGSDIGKTTVNRRPRTRLDGLFIFKSRVSKMHVHINKTRHQILARSINDAGVFWRRKVFSNLSNLSVFNQNVTDIIKMELWVNCMSSFKQIGHQILLQAVDTLQPYESKHRH